MVTLRYSALHRCTVCLWQLDRSLIRRCRFASTEHHDVHDLKSHCDCKTRAAVDRALLLRRCECCTYREAHLAICSPCDNCAPDDFVECVTAVEGAASNCADAAPTVGISETKLAPSGTWQCSGGLGPVTLQDCKVWCRCGHVSNCAAAAAAAASGSAAAQHAGQREQVQGAGAAGGGGDRERQCTPRCRPLAQQGQHGDLLLPAVRFSQFVFDVSTFGQYPEFGTDVPTSSHI
jgi:hypothetical protein